MTVEIQSKSAVTVAEMARMVGLSRARFYQLVGTAFPHPLYNVATRRPFYDEAIQAVCLEVRRRNCGVDGKPILFYARRFAAPAPAPKPAKPRVTKPRAAKPKNDDLIDYLRDDLGLANVTQAQVEAAVKELFPHGTNGTDNSAVITAVFRWLTRRDSAGSAE